MANRVLRDWTQSETVNDLSEGAEVFFTRLIMKADDFGCYYGNPKLLKAALFPLKDYNFNRIIIYRDECMHAGLIQVYKIDGKEYVQIVNFGQRLRQMNSKFPQPENIPPTLDSNPLPVDSVKPPETKRNEEETEEETNGADKSATHEQRALIFRDRVAEHLPDYPKEMLRAFYDYWTEMNEGGRKMRFEMQKVFDIKKRLVTWSNNEKKKFNGKQTSNDRTKELINGFAQRASQVLNKQ